MGTRSDDSVLRALIKNVTFPLCECNQSSICEEHGGHLQTATRAHSLLTRRAGSVCVCQAWCDGME